MPIAEQGRGLTPWASVLVASAGAAIATFFMELGSGVFQAAISSIFVTAPIGLAAGAVVWLRQRRRRR